MIPDGATKLENQSWLGAGHLAGGRARTLGGDAAGRSARDARHARRHAAAAPRVADRRPAPSCDRSRCARPASPSRCSPIRSSRCAAGRSGRRWRICRRSRASISGSRFATSHADDGRRDADVRGGAACAMSSAMSIYGEDDDDLAAVVLELCRDRRLTIGVAESCTGGLLGARLTAVPGSSDVVRGGVIAYHNDREARWAGRERRVAPRARCRERSGRSTDGRRSARASPARTSGWRSLASPVRPAERPKNPSARSGSPSTSKAK